MTRYRLKDVLAGTRGELRGEARSDLAFSRYERDSRKILPGDLYIAIKGEVHDGNEFTPDAITNGAAAALVFPGVGRRQSTGSHAAHCRGRYHRGITGMGALAARPDST
jgi:UDP-N-acetylmuramyl pentapeptide synthase